MSAQIHPNSWQAINSFLIKYAEVRCESWMRAMHLVLTLKCGLGTKMIMYTSYKNHTWAPLLPDTLYKLINNFFFI